MFNISKLEILTISHKYNLNITKQNEIYNSYKSWKKYNIYLVWYITKQNDMLSSYEGRIEPTRHNIKCFYSRISFPFQNVSVCWCAWSGYSDCAIAQTRFSWIINCKDRAVSCKAGKWDPAKNLHSVYSGQLRRQNLSRQLWSPAM